MAKQYEGSKADMKQDRAQAAKRKMPLKRFEGSEADKKLDKAGQRKMAKRPGMRAY